MKRLVLAFLLTFASPALAVCDAKFLNPASDVCWDCVFPLTIGIVNTTPGSNRPDTKNPAIPLCICPDFPLPRLGISIGIWEPALIADVANESGCFVNMGFDQDFGLHARKDTSVNSGAGMSTGSKWHVHFYTHPTLIYNIAAMDGFCHQNSGFAVQWMTEIDPLWMDAQLSLLMHPEAQLFANPVAQAACSADCVQASSGSLGNDALFWCDGCNGPLYPVTGFANQHVGGVQASGVASAKMLKRMHRLGLARRTQSSSQPLCKPKAAPVINKKQYRRQITRPRAATSGRFAGAPLGASAQLYGSGKEYAYGGESFGFIYWRKRNCCGS